MLTSELTVHMLKMYCKEGTSVALSSTALLLLLLLLLLKMLLRACEARALRARKTLTPRFTDFFADVEKKTDCFAVCSCFKSGQFNLPHKLRLYFLF